MMAAPDAAGEGTAEIHVAIQRISHELRTPLTVVIGFCELLSGDRPDDASIKEFAARISANAWMLQSAVERLIVELHSAEYTGPPDDQPLQCSVDPGAAPPKSPAVDATRSCGEADRPPADHAPADDLGTSF